MSRLPQNQAHKPQHQKWRRYEKPLPGHRLQIDAKFLAAIPGKRKSYWQYTAIDDCTRRRVLKIYERNNQKNAVTLSIPFSHGYPLVCRRSRQTTDLSSARSSTGTYRT
jgi:hypothetical protein